MPAWTDGYFFFSLFSLFVICSRASNNNTSPQKAKNLVCIKYPGKATSPASFKVHTPGIYSTRSSSFILFLLPHPCCTSGVHITFCEYVPFFARSRPQSVTVRSVLSRAHHARSVAAASGASSWTGPKPQLEQPGPAMPSPRTIDFSRLSLISVDVWSVGDG